MEPNGQTQPLEIEDFSGGLTENWYDSGPNRYQAADNFVITVDRKLDERPGSVPFDPVNYILPGNPRRVDGLFTYINESKLAVNQGRDIYVIPDSYLGWQTQVSGWSRVVGPSGNEAIGSGQAFSQTVMSEYAHQMYFTNETQPIPSKVFRDGTVTVANPNPTGAYTARTAGLPRVFNAAPYNDVCVVNVPPRSPCSMCRSSSTVDTHCLTHSCHALLLCCVMPSPALNCSDSSC